MSVIENLINKIARLILRPFPKFRDNEEACHSLAQFIKFGIVGVSNSIVSYVVYTVTLLLLRKFDLCAGYDYYVAQVSQFILSVLWAFYWNNKYVFQQQKGEKKRSVPKALLKTYITYSFSGLFLSSILLALWVDVLHISEFIAPIINIIICLPVNFLINKFWAFKDE